MNKKSFFFIILKFIPFFIGVFLFIIGNINLFSSLMLFLGGYVVIKNIFDYRVFRKNLFDIYNYKNNNSIDNDTNEKVGDNIIKNNYIRYDNNYDVKRVKVRKRIK